MRRTSIDTYYEIKDEGKIGMADVIGKIRNIIGECLWIGGYVAAGVYLVAISCGIILPWWPMLGILVGAWLMRP